MMNDDDTNALSSTNGYTDHVVNASPSTNYYNSSVSLAQELQAAKCRIKYLEQQLEQYENQSRLAKKAVTSRRRGFRRAPAENVFRNETPDQQDSIDSSNEEQLDEYISLTLLSCEKNDVNGDNTESEFISETNRSIGHTSIVGPCGVTIGSHNDCGIKLPSQLGVEEKHAVLKPNPREEDGLLEFWMVLDKDGGRKTLHNNSTFTTGVYKWKVKSLNKFYLLQSKLFATARKQLYSEFKAVVKDIEEWNTIMTSQGRNAFVIDLRSVENKNFRVSVDTKSKKNHYRHHQVTNSKIDRFSILHVAVDYDNGVDFVNILLKQVVDVNLQCGSRLLTPIHIACQHNNIEAVKVLIQNGADISLRDAGGNYPADVTEKYELRKMLTLCQYFCLASADGDLDELEKIYNSLVIDVNVIGYRGFSSLHLSSMNGHYECVNFLLRNKANVNVRCSLYNRTALHYACIADRADIAELLLNCGAITNVVDSKGFTPLQLVRSRLVCNLLFKGEMSLCMAVQINDVNLTEEILIKSNEQRTLNVDCEVFQKVISSKQDRRKTSKKHIFKDLRLRTLVDQENEFGMTPLQLAASSGNVEILQVLLSHGSKIDLPGGLKKQTALFFACLAGHANCVRFLIETGAEREFCDLRGMQCIDHMEDHAKELLDQLNIVENFSVPKLRNATDTMILPQYKHRLIVSNSFNEFPSELRALLDRVYNVIDVLQSGQQKLHDALKRTDHDGLVRLLSEGKLDVNRVLSKALPLRPLHYAASMGSERAVVILLTFNADPYLYDNQTYAPVHIAARHGFVKIVQTFLRHGVDVDLQTGIQKYSCLHISSINNQKNMVEFLLENGADKKLKDIDGNTAFNLASDVNIQPLLTSGDEQLYFALKQNDFKAIKLLLNSFDINTRFRDHTTPLHIACANGSFETCKLLIDMGAQMNVLGGSDKCTPLHYASKSASAETVKLLLKHGAELTLVDNHGRTPFEVASSNNIRSALIQANKKPESRHAFLKDDACRICLTSAVNTILLPCRHASFCSGCVSQISTCALDRVTITNVVLTAVEERGDDDQVSVG